MFQLVAPSAPRCCTRRFSFGDGIKADDDGIVLDGTQFLEWLAGVSPSAETARDLALLGCGFAMLFPSCAGDIHKRFLDLSGELRAMVMEERGLAAGPAASSGL